MAEWLKTAEIARRAGYSVSAVQAMIHNGVISREYTARDGKGYVINPAIIPWLIEHKQDWHAAVKQPVGVIHVPDPLGIQEGLWLTPDEARRLMTIRMYHRLYPTTQERNKAMRGDG